MAVTVKLQLYRDTALTRGYGDRNLDSVVIAGMVDGLDSEAADNINTAVEAAVAHAGANASTYGITDLDLADAKGIRIVDTRVWVILRYARLPTSEPLLAATANVVETSSLEWEWTVGTVSYVSPGGNTYTNYYYEKGPVNVTKYRMTTVLDTHPGTVIDYLVNKVNAADYAIGGRVATARTLLFQQPTIVPYAVRNGTSTTQITKYVVTYDFKWESNGFKRTIMPILAIGTTITPSTRERFGTADFSLIPTH